MPPPTIELNECKMAFKWTIDAEKMVIVYKKTCLKLPIRQIDAERAYACVLLITSEIDAAWLWHMGACCNYAKCACILMPRRYEMCAPFGAEYGH